MAAPVYDYRIDWNGDDDFDDTGENVTARVLAGEKGISYGRDQARALSPLAPGDAKFDLDNFSRDYSPENGSSPLVGLLAPGRKVRIQATHLSTTYGLFSGYLDNYDLVPESRQARFTCIDALERVRSTPVSTELFEGIRTGEAIHAVLDAIGWPADDRDVDPGATTIQYWWAEGNAGQEIEKLVNSEGPTALVTVDPDGAFVFRDRHHRLTRTASTTSQATFRAGTNADPRFSEPLGYDHGWRDVVNSVDFAVDIRADAGELETVWSSSTALFLDDGETVQIVGQAGDPFHGAVTPEPSVDYETASGVVEVTLSRLSGRTVTVSVKAVGGPAMLTKVGFRAYPISTTHTIRVKASDSASLEKHGPRAWTREAPWVGIHDAEAIATIIVGQRAERLPIVKMRVNGYSDTNRTQMLARDLSDRITIIDSLIGINDAFFIEQISHSIRGGGEQSHETEFGCERAPVPPAGFILNTSLLNTGVLGTAGYDNPATMFRLGTSLLNTGMLAL